MNASAGTFDNLFHRSEALKSLIAFFFGKFLEKICFEPGSTALFAEEQAPSLLEGRYTGHCTTDAPKQKDSGEIYKFNPYGLAAGCHRLGLVGTWRSRAYGERAVRCDER